MNRQAWMTYVLAPTRAAAETWTRNHGIAPTAWMPYDATFRLRGRDPGATEVVVLDGGGNRYDVGVLLTVARERGIHVRHDRSLAVPDGQPVFDRVVREVDGVRLPDVARRFV